jgi:hypothetical protein
MNKINLPKIIIIKKDQNLRNIIPAISLVIGFIFIVSLSIYFIKETYSQSCNCNISVPIIISILTSLGVFVGILTYYFLSKSFSKEKEKIFGNVEKTLDFLDKEEKEILIFLIKNKGELNQNNLSNITKIDSVKLHRRLLNLESKGIINKKKSGMTNKIILNEDLIDLFIK